MKLRWLPEEPFEPPVAVELPLCKCHEEPKHKAGVRDGRQEWRCAVRARERNRLFRAAHPDLDSERREKLRDAGLCTKCGVREAEPLGALCIRCLRYNAMHHHVGYSNIPIAKGSEG
jgi:hypothetical protein